MPVSDANPFFQEFEVRLSLRFTECFCVRYVYESEYNSFA